MHDAFLHIYIVFIILIVPNNAVHSIVKYISQIPRNFVFKSVVTVSGVLLTPNLPAYSDEVWTDRNRLAADTWRAVDEIYYDRSFGGNDWFKLRQEVVKRDYKTDAELYEALSTMLGKLGDKYTRYLPPARYSALMNSALGELTGVGIELLSRDDGKVVISNVQDDSPAQAAGLQSGDVLVNVDGTSTVGLGPEEVAALSRYLDIFCAILISLISIVSVSQWQGGYKGFN